MKVIKYIFLLCLCWSCRQDEPGFTVKGKIEGYPGTKLFVTESSPTPEKSNRRAWSILFRKIFREDTNCF